MAASPTLPLDNPPAPRPAGETLPRDTASPAASAAPGTEAPPASLSVADTRIAAQQLEPAQASRSDTPADAPAAARPAATPTWPARQIAPFAVALALGPDASLTVTLDPAELGRVEVAIERSGAEARITVTAERPETLLLLQRDRTELERALSTAGFGGASGGPALSFGGGGGEGRQQRQEPRGTPRATPTPAAAPLAQPGLRSLLDLAI
ncbi:flagellar hook-length control protein FliK [Falsiroseomonas oryziterrae]|uniref:flagellar hook-length control protein FliK n=1 Tax=Falsiroseomonas oryziterrae TaxID=2911368 RepID=UPI001F2B3CD9|nr:flagellar hook-length control protein FliK [Roseomonas sp. NPKOSM-4]